MNEVEPEISVLGKLQARLTGNALGTIVGRVIGIGLSLLINIQLGQEMESAEYGVWGILFSIVMIASSFGKFSLSELMTQIVAQCLTLKDSSLVQTAVRRLSGMSVVTGALASAAACGIAYWLVDPTATTSSVGKLALLSGLITFLSVVCQMYGGYFRGIHYASVIALSVPIPSGLVVGPLLAVVINRQLWLGLPVSLELVLTTWAIGLGICWIILEVMRQFVQPGEVPEEAAGITLDQTTIQTSALFMMAFPLMLSELMFHILMQGDLWLASFVATDEQIGYLTGAKRLGNLVDLPVAMGNLALASTFAELYLTGKLKDLERLSRRVAALLALLGFFACLLGVFFGSSVMALVFKPEYAQAGHYLGIITCSRLAFAVGGPASVILMMTNGGRVLLIGYASSVVVMLGFSAVLGPVWGIPGLLVAAGLGIATSVFIFCLALYSRDKILTHAPGPWHPDGIRWWIGLLNSKNSN